MKSQRFSLRLAAIVIAFSALLSSPAVTYANNPSVAAFSQFIHEEKFDEANFYLANGIVRPAEIDTTQLFFNVLTQRFYSDMSVHARRIDRLYNYLHALSPIDFNRSVVCGSDSRCLLATNLLQGAKRDAIAYFVERGAKLNFHVPGIVPPSVPLLLRLGSVYSVDDLNYLTSLGLSLGADTYVFSELREYRDEHARLKYQYAQLALPAELLVARDLNLLDMLVVSLGTMVNADALVQSRRRRVLCEFITYAAPSYTPAFDYLSFLIDKIPEFRAGSIKQMAQLRGRNEHYEVFPASCVTLLHSMALSHGDIVSIINRLAAERDTQTANWLISITKSR